MIIQVDSAATDSMETARQRLETLTGSWGHPITETPDAAPAGRPRGDSKGTDIVAVATLVLSIPQAVLAVMDLADRITKRQRAQELISQAQQLTSQHVTINVVSGNNIVELSGLTPDQLLELANEVNPESEDGQASRPRP